MDCKGRQINWECFWNVIILNNVLLMPLLFYWFNTHKFPILEFILSFKNQMDQTSQNEPNSSSSLELRWREVYSLAALSAAVQSAARCATGARQFPWRFRVRVAVVELQRSYPKDRERSRGVTRTKVGEVGKLVEKELGSYSIRHPWRLPGLPGLERISCSSRGRRLQIVDGFVPFISSARMVAGNDAPFLSFSRWRNGPSYCPLRGYRFSSRTAS